jgi:uncharacterized protein (TIGR04255 family)
VFSVQFEHEVIDEVGILSEFWPSIRASYSELEKHPPLPPVAETFDNSLPQVQIRLQSFGGATPLRYWFLDEPRVQLVQVQPDRLVFNWRKVEGTERYPGYAVLLPQFIELLRAFLACEQVAAAGIPVDWVEIQYINPIEIEPHEGAGHGPLANILNMLVEDPPRGSLPPVEDTQLQERFRITWPNGESRGRLYLTAVPAFTPARAPEAAKTPAYILTLLARGRRGTEGETIDAVGDFLNVGHDLIVHGFREVTTTEMRARWGEL